MELPKTDPASIDVKHEGLHFQLVFTACRVSLAGESAGNVEVEIACDPSVEPVVEECLRLRDPGRSTSGDAIASGGEGSGFSLTFHSGAIELLSSAPESLTFLWRDETLASVEATITDSVPLERLHTLEVPARPPARQPAAVSNVVRLAASREALWLLPALLLALAGAALVVAPDGLHLGSVPFRVAGGLVSFAMAAGVAAAGYGIPHRQVWYDRSRRRVWVVEGRAFPANASQAEAGARDLAEFAHVRICERHYAPGIGDESDGGRVEWLASLEGPIPFAAPDGRVHSRSDALLLDRCQSGRRARRVAESVAHATGLRILEATDW